MSIIKSNKTVTKTYTLAPDVIKDLICRGLGSDPAKTTVQFVITEVGGCEYPPCRGTPTVTKIEVTVKS